MSKTALKLSDPIDRLIFESFPTFSIAANRTYCLNEDKIHHLQYETMVYSVNDLISINRLNYNISEVVVDFINGEWVQILYLDDLDTLKPEILYETTKEEVEAPVIKERKKTFIEKLKAFFSKRK
jgi:hypothetical protein